MEGYGVYHWPSGDRYEGEFVNGLKQGDNCKFFWHDGCEDGLTYEGEYMNDKQHGNGYKTWNDGRSYQGQFVGNEMEGHGTMNFPNG